MLNYSGIRYYHLLSPFTSLEDVPTLSYSKAEFDKKFHQTFKVLHELMIFS